MAARVAVTVVAVVVLSYLGVALRDFRLLGGALTGAGGDTAAAVRDLEAAGRFNPDPTPDITRAFLLDGSGKGPQARALLRDVVRREPDNLGAWRVLEEVAGNADPALADRARAAQRRLDPLG